jgi:thioredoxin-like negative regulator of GroEL
MEAYRLSPENLMISVNIATCYYNIGVEIEETIRSLTVNSAVKKERARSAGAFEQAVIWLDKAYQQEPDDPEVVARVYDLYKALRQTEKAKNIENQINGSK